jgi:hypothetical protein
VTPEAPLERDANGLGPAGPGWFVVNAREARWFELPGLGAYVRPYRDGDLPSSPGTARAMDS